MQCCNPSTVSIDRPFGFPNTFKAVSGCRKAAIKDTLKRIVTPEPTDRPHLAAALNENRLFGAIKTLFWAVVSVGIGTALAVVCN